MKNKRINIKNLILLSAFAASFFFFFCLAAYSDRAQIEAYPAEGNSYTLLSFSHPGGRVTIPYAVPKGTTLELTVVNKVVSKKTVN